MILNWITTSFCLVLFHFIVWGVLMASVTRHVAQTYLQADERSKIHSAAEGHRVEPMYAFDIHCNGFFPMILIFYFGNVRFSLSSQLEVL